MPYQEPRQPSRSKVVPIWHIVMGVMFMVLGTMMMIYKYFGALSLKPDIFAYLAGGGFIFYGITRIIRGVNALRELKIEEQ